MLKSLRNASQELDLKMSRQHFGWLYYTLVKQSFLKQWKTMMTLQWQATHRWLDPWS